MIPASLHRLLDFVTVVAFALAPTVLGLTGLPAALAYLLAAVHLAMTLLTKFSSKGARPVPLGFHGVVELIVGLALVALPWLLRWHGTPQIFYVAAGAVILLVWALSRYGHAAAAASVG